MPTDVTSLPTHPPKEPIFLLDYRKAPSIDSLTDTQLNIIQDAKIQIKSCIKYMHVGNDSTRTCTAQDTLQSIWSVHGEHFWTEFYMNIGNLCRKQLEHPHHALPVEIRVLGEDYHDYVAFTFLVRGFPNFARFNKPDDKLGDDSGDDSDDELYEPLPITEYIRKSNAAATEKTTFIMLLDNVPIGYTMVSIDATDSRTYKGYTQPLGCYGYIDYLRRITYADTGVRFLRATSKHLMNAAINFMKSRSVRGVEILPMDRLPCLVKLYSGYGFKFLEPTDIQPLTFLASSRLHCNPLSKDIPDSRIHCILQSTNAETGDMMVLYPIESYVMNRREDVHPSEAKKRTTLCESDVQYFQHPVWDLF